MLRPSALAVFWVEQVAALFAMLDTPSTMTFDILPPGEGRA
jgi:hypothetical protein